jgi:hypothetical protein
MALSEDIVVAPRLTRWVQSLLLSSVEGVSVGLAIGTLRVSEKLLPYVATNRNVAGVRQAIIGAVLSCAVAVPLLLLASCALPHSTGRRLNTFELRAKLLSPLSAVGFIPLLFRPELWKDKLLGFLLMTGLFSVAAMLSSATALRAAASITRGRGRDDLVAVGRVLRLRISPKATLGLSIVTILLLAAYGLSQTFSATKTPATSVLTEWAVIQKFSTYHDFSLWFTGIGFRALGHVSILGALYSVWAWIWPKSESLFWLRLLAVSWPALPLLLWTRKSIGPVAAWIMAATYLSLPVRSMVTATDVFPISFSVGLFFLSGYYFELRRSGCGLLVALAAIALNEQAALWYVTLGLFFSTRQRGVRWGTWLALGATCYFAYVAFVLLPHSDVLTYIGDLPKPGVRDAGPLPSSQVESFVNFSYAMPRWLENQSLEFWLALLLPLGLLPLMNSRWLLWLVPVIVLSYLSKMNPDFQNSSYMHFAVLAIVSSVASLERLKRSDEGPSYRYASVFVGWVAALLPCVVMLGTLWFPIQ